MKNIQTLIKRDLERVPLMAYFFFYFIYLLFDKILELKDYAVLVKPIIIPIIAFLYISNKNSKRNLLSIFLLLLIFISDNSSLLEIRSFYVYTMIMYMFSVFILLYYALLDIKLFKSNNFVRKNVGYVLLSIILTTLLYWFCFYNAKERPAEKFIIFEYLIVFLVLFFISTLNYIQQKTKQTKYLFLTILSLFLSQLCFSIHKYYNGHILFMYVICFIEIPVYYFLLKYLLRRDKEVIAL